MAIIRQSLRKSQPMPVYPNFRLNTDTTSEVFIYIDDANGMPIKQEFFAVEGEGKRSVMTIEVRDLKLEPADDLFAIPSGFSNAKTPN